MGEYKPSVVRKLIQFMYTGEYDQSTAHATEKDAGSDADQPEPPNDSARDAGEAPIGSHVQAPDSSALEALLEHIRVNSIADYYQVGPLIALANEKIQKLLRDPEHKKELVAGLPAAIETALDATGDLGLLDVFAEAVVANIGDFIGMSTFEQLFGSRSNGSALSFKIIRQLGKAMKAALDEKIGELYKTTDELRKAIGLSAERQDRISDLERLLRHLSGYQNCMNCCIQFNCSIEPKNSEWLLRCSKCKCKHF